MQTRKRKPLADITNTYNLIPTSTLRKLVAASSDSSSNPKLPVSISKSNSSPTNQKCSESSNRSETSIGSSNVSALRNLRTVRFRSPPREISSITSLGGSGSKDAARNRRQITETSKKGREAAVVIVSSPTPAEKRKDKGKAIDVPFSSPPPQKRKEKGKATDVPFSSPPPEKRQDKGKAIDVPFSSPPPEKRQDKGKAIDVPFSSPPPEKRQDKGKAIAVPFSSPLPEKQNHNQNEVCYHASPLEGDKQKVKENLSLFDMVKDSDEGILKTYRSSYGKTRKGKATLNSSGSARGEHEGIGTDRPSFSFEKRNDEKSGILDHSGISTLKMKNIANEFVNPSNFIFERPKEKGKPISPFNSSYEKANDEGEAILQPSDVVEITTHKGPSAAVTVDSRPPRRKSGRRKNDAGASSCPPVKRTTNILIDLDEPGDSKDSKSWTDPNPKCRKKRCSSVESTPELPLDFIEQTKQYFKEVDEFELLEEEVSSDELE